MQKTLLVTLDYPPLIGGVANYYFNLIKNMPTEEIVVLMNKVDGYEKILEQNKFKIYYKNFFIKFIWPQYLPLIWHVWRTVKKENIKRMWVGQVLPVGSVVWLLSKILNVPYFITCHGNELLRSKKYARKYKLAKKILRDAEYIEANTQFTKNILINDYKIPEQKIKIVYPVCTLSKDMIDNEKVEQLKNKYSLHDKKVLLTVGNLVESKGNDQVIKALTSVWQEVYDLFYLIIGSGPFKEKLTQVVNKLPVEHKHKIIFINEIQHSELPNYYALANLFIMTPRKIGTDSETFGIVYLEAKEFNLPIIAGDVGGAREAVGAYEKTIFVNSENIDEISTEIKKIVQ